MIESPAQATVPAKASYRGSLGVVAGLVRAKGTLFASTASTQGDTSMKKDLAYRVVGSGCHGSREQRYAGTDTERVYHIYVGACQPRGYDELVSFPRVEA